MQCWCYWGWPCAPRPMARLLNPAEAPEELADPVAEEPADPVAEEPADPVAEEPADPGRR